ncbi:MAG: hypothetical protein PHQ86_08785 [Dehalococcoidales bacterium]|nr:hypothetical protein [Dehalococcoidales bacterium]
MSTNAGNYILDLLVMQTDSLPYGTVYCALYNGNPEDGGTECTGTEYQRVVCSLWEMDGKRAIKNNSSIIFQEVETEDWGSIDHIVLLNEEFGIIAYYELDSPVELTEGMKFSIAIGDIEVSFESGGIIDGMTENILKAIFLGTDIGEATDIEICLNESAMSDEVSLNEPEDTYERQSCPLWSEPENGQTKNQYAVSFPAPESGSWGIVSGFINTLGFNHYIVYGTCYETVSIGEVIQFLNESITVTVDGS